MPANLAADKSPADDKHTTWSSRKSEYNDESTRSTPRQSSTSYQNRRPSVTFDLPPLSYHPGDEQPHQFQSQHRKRISTHSKTSSIGSIGGQSITSSVSSSISASSAAATPTSAASPARRQLRKKKRASTISSFTTVEERTSSSSSSVMRFGVKLDFNKRSSKRISQDSFSKELPPLPHEILEKRVSGRLPLPPFDLDDSAWYSGAPIALVSPPIHEEAVLHISNRDKRRSSTKSRTDLPPLPSEAAHTQHHHYNRQKQTTLSSAQHLAEVKRQTELWLSMLCSSDDEGDNLFTPSLSSSSSNSSLNGKSPTPSSDCCDPDFLASEKPYAVALPELPLPYTSPILLPPFTDVQAHPLNPFEASFASSRNRQPSSSEVVLANRRRSSLPTQSLANSGALQQRRLDKHRPPPLSLTPIHDSPAEETTAVQTVTPPPPPQYRSRSLSHDLRPLDPLSLYHRRFHRSSQDTTDLSTSTLRSRENSVSSSSAASMIFTSSNDSSIDNGSNGRRFSSATTISSNMPSPNSPNHPRTPTLQDLLEEEGASQEKTDGKAVKHGSRQDLALSRRHSKQGSTGSIEVVMYGVAR